MRLTNQQAQVIALATIAALTYDDDRGNRVWIPDVNGGDVVEALTAVLADTITVEDDGASDDEA